MRRPASFERYALLTSAALLLVLLPVRAADREDGKTGSGSGDSERSSERSCRPGQGSGSTSFSGSVRAPLFINKVWTRHGQIWFGDVLFGAIGHIEIPDGVSVDGKFSSRFWPIDVIQVVGSSIVFQSGRHRSGSIRLTGPDVSLGQDGPLPAGTYLVGATGTPTGLLFHASNGVSIAVVAFPPRGCEEPDGRANVLEEAEFPEENCLTHFARIWSDGGRCTSIPCASRGGSAYAETVANSVGEVECARYCQRFSCSYVWKFTPCARAGCGRAINSCPDGCENLDFCQAYTQEDDPPKYNCFCWPRPDAGS
jgi:hypothetical protein